MNSGDGSDDYSHAASDETRISASGPAKSPIGPDTARRSGMSTDGLGAHIGPYKVLQLIGEGGFGSVFLAQQEAPVVRKVALKIIKLGMDTRQVVARFEAERQALALMDHPNIAKVLDGGATDTGRPFFVMELVRGVPIMEYCDKHSLAINERLSLFLQICQAVQHAHQKGVIHRDLKPSNVLVSVVDDRPVVKVIDFGVAKATDNRLTDKTLFTEYQQMVGTPQYMSPEQAEGSLDVDTRTDVYSLGVLLYELLTGTTPFDARRLRSLAKYELVRLIRETEAPRPSTRLSQLSAVAPAPPREQTEPSSASRAREPGERAGDSSVSSSAAAIALQRRTDTHGLVRTLRGDLDWITIKALEKDRTRRYDSPSAMAADVLRYLNHEPVSAGPPGAAYRVKKFARRHRGMLAAVCGIALALIVGLSLAVSGMVQAGRARNAAEQARLRESEQRQLAEVNEARAVANQARAETSQAKAEAINKFLLDMLGSADPYRAGRDAKVSEALDRAAEDVEQSFENQPEVEAGVRRILGSTYLALGMINEAEPHIDAALRLYRTLQSENSREVAQCLRHKAWVQRERGNLASAEELGRSAVEIMERAASPQDSDYLEVRTDLALTLRLEKKFDESEVIYRKTLETRRLTFGNESSGTVIAINSLAVLMHDMERLDEAEELYREALDICESFHGNEHPDTITQRINLGSILNSRGQVDEAEKLFVETMPLLRRVFGARSPKTATGLRVLGELYQSRGRFREALPLLREALDISRPIQGDRSEPIARVKQSLSQVLARLDENAEAAALQREVVDIYRERFGPEALDTLVAMAELANRLTTNDEKVEAETILQGLIETCPRVLGPDHKTSIIAVNTYAVLLHDLDRLDEAEKYYRQALETGRRAMGEDHPDTLITLHNLMCVLRDRGQLDEAQAFGREMLERFTRVFGPRHANVASAQYQFALVLRKLGKNDEAEPLLLQSLKTRRSRLGEHHPSVATTQIELGLLYIDVDRTPEADVLLREALAARQAQFGSEDARTAAANSALGLCLTKLGQFEDAERLLQDAFAILKRKKGEENKDARRTARRLAELYETWEALVPGDVKAEQAALWRCRSEGSQR